ncbi:MAG: universal stress protein [Deltaproteobacteria bacterium]|jgi:nucleotide-binding universal stress UspA family protein|nr:universal stress protein [Deltaproteobacteria bacterium]
MQNHPKILLAVDGSAASLTAVQHSGRMFSKQSQMVLFHVLSEIPEAFKDLDGRRFIDAQKFPLDKWQAHCTAGIKDFMEVAHAVLMEAGFEPRAVEVRVQDLKSGIARDIHRESQRGYAALVVGRTGVNKINQITMGSVAAKLVDVTAHIPIIVVGEHQESKKILLALDGSKSAMRAVKFIAAVIEPHPCEIMLCHVVRPLNLQQLNAKALFTKKHEKEWIAANQRKMVPVFVEAKKQLMHAGIAANNLSTEILTDEQSRAAAIAKAATDGGYDTIAMGRRGFTSVEDFKLGRVCRKIVHFAFRPALWIVS